MPHTSLARHPVSSRLIPVLFIALLLPAMALAQGTGRSLDIDLSPRSSGMGGAGNAVFWGDGPNAWANPAVLGYLRGAAFSWGEAKLLPMFSDDIAHTSRRFAIGFAGLGFETAGKGPGETRLSYGSSEGTDSGGNSTGMFEAFEDVDAWRVGFSIAEMVGTISRLGGRPVPALARRADIALGWADKAVDIRLAPGFAARGEGKDFGVLLRGAPVLADPEAGWPMSVDVSYGYSVLNYNDERITFINEDQASPLTRMKRHGVAGRLALGVPASLREGALKNRPLLLQSIDPFITLGVAHDWEQNSAGGVSDFYDVQRFGTEVGVANILTLRAGHVTDRLGDIDGFAWGFGLGFHVGHAFAFRYDYASVPLATGLDENRKDQGVVMTFDLAQALAKP